MAHETKVAQIEHDRGYAQAWNRIFPVGYTTQYGMDVMQWFS